jgi:hypothetical protein
VVPPISSGCTADPFTSDGAACPRNAAGTPFFLFADGAPGSQKLFARAYRGSGTTRPATGITSSGATLNATVNPGGAVVNVHFEFGPTAAYGQVTPTVRVGPGTTGQAFAQAISGLAPSTTIHFRVVVASDFVTAHGADAQFTTLP